MNFTYRSLFLVFIAGQAWLTSMLLCQSLFLVAFSAEEWKLYNCWSACWHGRTDCSKPLFASLKGRFMFPKSEWLRDVPWVQLLWILTNPTLLVLWERERERGRERERECLEAFQGNNMVEHAGEWPCTPSTLHFLCSTTLVCYQLGIFCHCSCPLHEPHVHKQ